MRIRFSYDGVSYTVSHGAYKESGRIRLPDGRVLKVGMWLESSPPQARDIEAISEDAIQGRPVFDATRA